MEHIFRIFDFNVYNEKENPNNGSGSEEEQEQAPAVYKDTTIFLIQVFGVNELGKTFSVIVEGFKPFFYVMVSDKWTIQMKEQFIAHLIEKMGKYYSNSITSSKIIRRKKFGEFILFSISFFI